MHLLRPAALCFATGALLACSTEPQRADGHGGFACSTETFTWVQLTPCKPTITETRGDQTELPDGSRIFVDYGVEVPVTQSELSHEAVCKKLRQGPEEVGQSAVEVAEMLADAKCV